MTQNTFNTNISNIKQWYHGTSLSAYNQILETGIKNMNPKLEPMYNNINSPYLNTIDFGPGFYLTSHYDQAARWAKDRPLKENDIPIVMSFDLDEFITNYNICTFKSPNRKFAQLVKYCRLSGYNDPKYKSYSAIYGPVIDGGILTYVYRIRKEYLDAGIESKNIPENISYQQFIDEISLNQYYPQKDQLAITDSNLLNDFMNKYFIKYVEVK